MRKLIFTLLVCISFCTFGFAQNSVIEPELQAAIEQKGDEMISVNIIFKSQMDPMRLRNRVAKVSDKKIKRDIVVDELKNFSEQEQANVMAILNAEEKSGKVTKITKHWLSNVITCTTTPEVIYYLSTHSDIALIGYNQEKYMLWGEEPKSIDEPVKDQTTQNIRMVNADDVWDLGFTGEGVIVAVIDTGVNYNHVDLADHLWDGGEEFPNHGYNTYDNNTNTMDGNSHGTHCSGTVCGDGTSGTKTGMAPDATLMCVKCLNDGGSGDANTIAGGMEFAVEHYADVMSLSLGIPQSTVSERTMLRQTCVNALEAGVVAAIAVGNEGDQQWMYPIPNNVRVPGSCPPPWLHPEQEEGNPGELSCVVAIGAVDYYDNPASFTSHGPVTWTNTEYGDYPHNPGIGLIRPDVCAPGVDIISCDYSNINGHTSMSGTSMATPCAAGVMCLLLSKNIDLTPAEVCMIFEATALPLSENKSNVTGSGRIDALAAIENTNIGSFKVESYSFVELNGNGNNNLNAGEEVGINLDIVNTSEDNINNVNIVIRSTNELASMLDSTATISSIASLETISLTDEFSFIISEDAAFNSKLKFNVEILDSNNEKLASANISATIKGNHVIYSKFIIENDDNGNGMLESGENADLSIILENEGNEIAVSVNGVISCDDEDITINQNEAYFNSIGENSSAIASYNITASNTLPDIYNIPIELNVTDAFGNDNIYEIIFANKCNVVFNLTDTWGDGWNGAKLVVSYSDGTPQDNLTVESGSSETHVREISSGVEVSLSWLGGSFDSECKYEIQYESGEVIYSGQGSQQGVFFTWINNCSCGSSSQIDECDPVQNMNVNNNLQSVELSWQAPANGSALHYEIYRDTKLLGTTEELDFNDEVDSEGTYYYSVRPMYNDCNGSFVCVAAEIVNCPKINDLNVNVEELNMTLTWTEPNDMTDFVEYRVYINDELVGNTTETTFSQELTVGDYNAAVEAVFASCQSLEDISFSICDPIVNIDYVVDNNTINLTWTIDEDINITKYEIYINNVLTAESDINSWSSTFEAGYYDFMITAITEDCYPISKEIKNIMICNMDATISIETQVSDDYIVELTWNAVDYITAYEIYRDEVKIAQTTENHYTDNSISENGTYCYTVAPKCNENIGNISEEACLSFNVGVNEISNVNISVYPNPSKDNFTIVCDKMTKVSVYNILGENIFEENVTDEKYELSGLNAGTYFLQIETTEGIIVKRVVKM